MGQVLYVKGATRTYQHFVTRFFFSGLVDPGALEQASLFTSCVIRKSGSPIFHESK